MSDTLAIGTYDSRTSFRPGEAIRGRAMWMLEKDAEAVEVRLFWYTSGKGTQDVGIVETRAVPSPGRRGETEFSFRAPAGPHSFSGKLISLQWAVEVVVLPGKEAQRQDLTIAPTGREIILHST